jgi:predicted MFS family arabinose efflux permease
MSWSPRLWALLLLLSANMLLDALEVSTIVVGMPSIGAGLHLTPAVTSLVMIGFALGFGGSILFGGLLAARFGRRRVYLGALLVFAVASIAGGLAVDGPMLVATRVVKGICVALMTPAGLAIIANTFAEGPPRSRAVSIYTLCGASGFSAGLLLSGALTMISWRWTLLFSGPVALALLLLGTRLIPGDDTGGAPVRLRLDGVLTGTLFRSAAGAAALNGPYWGFLLVATFELQSGLGWSPLAAGLVLLPSSLPLMLTAMYSGRIVVRFGPGRLVAAGSLAAFLGYAWYLGAGTPVRLAGILPTVLLVGIGFMLSFSALHFQAIAGVPPGRQGIVSGVYQTSVQLGGVLMLGLVAFVTGPNHRPALFLVAAVAAAGLAVAVAGLLAGRTGKATGGESWPPTRSKSLSS